MKNAVHYITLHYSTLRYRDFGMNKRRFLLVHHITSQGNITGVKFPSRKNPVELIMINYTYFKLSMYMLGESAVHDLR